MRLHGCSRLLSAPRGHSPPPPRPRPAPHSLDTGGLPAAEARGRPRAWTTEPTAEDRLCRGLPAPCSPTSTSTRARWAGPARLVFSHRASRHVSLSVLSLLAGHRPPSFRGQPKPRPSLKPPVTAPGPVTTVLLGGTHSGGALWGQERVTSAQRLASQKLGSFTKREQVMAICLGYSSRLLYQRICESILC